jgi:hypothetical protein
VFDGERRALCRVCDRCQRALVAADARRWRPVPRRWLHDPGLRASWAEWRRLGLALPVGALVRDSVRGWVARAPDGGELRVDEAAVAELGARTPLVAEARADVEALVVGGRPEPELWLVPIDTSELLATHARRHWRGAGTAAWLVLDTFFEALRAQSRPVGATLARRPRWRRALS